MKYPHVVNKFETETEAIHHAVTWSKERSEQWTVIHGPSDEGLRFYVERGDGGMIRSTERKVGTWANGQKETDE